ncbi:MAG TPA: glycosyltransferase [Steroidobacteraceae bacterium]|nr:glycosyltransferase [Steroidobacteraceae bacterium]
MVYLALVIWVYLIFAHGRFWRSGPQLPPAVPANLPSVDIIVPARDEQETIGAALASLRAQDYAGTFRIILVDDESADDTVAAAGAAPCMSVIRGAAKPAGWSGKLWALDQGVAASHAPVLLFADADIVHDPRHLSSLVARLLTPRAQMVSEIVRLNCQSPAERLLVPAFVYFFQLLYPFARVNEPTSRVAAACGGTVLIRREALQRIGGIASIKDALIDDVALAAAVKKSGPIYLGHSGLAASIRRYPRCRDIWRLISRTAFTQLRHSAGMLALTLAGLMLVWLLPLGAALCGHGAPAAAGLAAYALAAVSYLPTLERYRQNRFLALALPLIALFYMAATVDSACNHWFGKGVRWKNRDYAGGR